jgi:alkanesulfonate monooxygenase SsuD/methylene tetrahydromethanopterin reductase-like flavin-dependent oxidoreductase (luciferase family)
MPACQGTHGFPDILWEINRDFVLFWFLFHAGIIPSIYQHIKSATLHVLDPIAQTRGCGRDSLKLVAQYADVCNIYGDLATIQRKFAILKQHCETVGRDYESVRRTAGLACIIGETEEQARAKIGPALLRRPSFAGALIGTPAMLRTRLAELEAAGVQEVILGFPDVLQLESLRFFAREFIA